MLVAQWEEDVHNVIMKRGFWEFQLHKEEVLCAITLCNSAL